MSTNPTTTARQSHPSMSENRHVTVWHDTPRVGDEFRVDRPDWVFVGTVVAVERAEEIAGSDENGVRWQHAPGQFKVTVRPAEGFEGEATVHHVKVQP